jgi:large subunit ribosomal protein L10
MEAEKQLLVREISDYLDGTDYIYLADFTGITVGGIASLRRNLREDGAQCHVVKNRILRIALRESGYAPLDEHCFRGHTAMITGGDNPSGVAKILFKFAKGNDAKLPVKGGALAKNSLSVDEIRALSELPSLEVLRAQLLALLGAPAQRCVAVLNGVPQGVVNVLQARAKE